MSELIREAVGDGLRAIHAELLKLRRTPALMLTIVTPYLAVILFFFLTLNRGHRLFGGRPEIAWPWLVQSVLALWVPVLMPLLIALVAAFLADLELRGQQWKHLFGLPVRRGAFYFAKVFTATALLSMSTFLLLTGAWLAGRVVHLLKPNLGFGRAFPVAESTRYLAAVVVAASVLVALHTWLSLRFKSFVPGISLGFLGMSLAGILKLHDLWPWFPWRLTMSLLDGLDRWKIDWTWPLVAVSTAGLFTLVGSWDVTRRDVC